MPEPFMVRLRPPLPSVSEPPKVLGVVWFKVSVATGPVLLVIVPAAPLSLLIAGLLPLRSRTPALAVTAPPGSAPELAEPSCRVPALTSVVPE